LLISWESNEIGKVFGTDLHTASAATSKVRQSIQRDPDLGKEFQLLVGKIKSNAPLFA
jgi:hypothetical protein